MRMGTIYWDDNTGEASLRFNDNFNCQAGITKLDALQDIAGQVDRMYESIGLYDKGTED